MNHKRRSNKDLLSFLLFFLFKSQWTEIDIKKLWFPGFHAKLTGEIKVCNSLAKIRPFKSDNNYISIRSVTGTLNLKSQKNGNLRGVWSHLAKEVIDQWKKKKFASLFSFLRIWF